VGHRLVIFGGSCLRSFVEAPSCAAPLHFCHQNTFKGACDLFPSHKPAYAARLHFVCLLFYLNKTDKLDLHWWKDNPKTSCTPVNVQCNPGKFILESN
jgi:hypothetical protein